MVDEGHEVHYVAFSAAERSLASDLPRGILREEVVKATEILGIRREHLHVLDFEVRDFPAHRQEILEHMVQLQAQLVPDMVFLPSTDDTHQDHQTVSGEGFRAFKRTTILGYELPWNNLSFTTSAFAALSQEQLSRKVLALEQYKSQAGRSYAKASYIRNLANVRGIQIGIECAEAFQAIRWIMR